MQKWKRIFKSSKGYRVKIVKDILEEKNIRIIIINKKDSMYTMLGQSEVLVEDKDFLKALKVIQNEIKFKEI